MASLPSSALLDDVGEVYQEFLAATGSESRQAQLDGLRVIAGHRSPGHVALQAPTGTGKSFCALLAGVVAARHGRRTVIGTATVRLSEQYVPDMERVCRVFPDVKMALLKGADHYACLSRVGKALDTAGSEAQKKLLKNELRAWRKAVDAAKDGQVVDPEDLDPPAWARAESASCRENGCSPETCDFTAARKAADDADVVVTSHAMIGVDMQIRGAQEARATAWEQSQAFRPPEEDGEAPRKPKTDGVLGPLDLVIFDEAHEAHAYLSREETFGYQVVRMIKKYSLLAVIANDDRRAELEKFFLVIGSSNRRSRIYAEWCAPTPDSARSLLAGLPTPEESELIAAYAELLVAKQPSGLESLDPMRLYGELRKLDDIRKIAEEIAAGRSAGDVALWVNEGIKVKRVRPDSKIVDRLGSFPVVWMSATLGTESRPTFALDRLGIGDARLVSLATPFDFSRQLSYFFYGLDANYAGHIAWLSDQTAGGVLVICTTHRQKTKIVELLTARGLDVRCQADKEDPHRYAKNRAAFEAHCAAADVGGSPILVGVDMFATGIDLKGNRCTQLVLLGLRPIRDDEGYQQWLKRWHDAQHGPGAGVSGYEIPAKAMFAEQAIGRLGSAVRVESVAGT